MKKVLLFFLLCMQIEVYTSETTDSIDEKYITVLMLTSNAQCYVQKALDSVFNQNYQNYMLLVIDDCSEDDTAEYIKEYAQEKGHDHHIAVHKNKIRREVPLINYLRAVKVSNPEDIVLVLSPQDCLAHDEVLADVNNIYQSDDVWMTYGPVRCYPSRHVMHNYQIPKEVVYLGGYRDCLNIPMYLHSFRASLFKKIEIRDLCYEGAFLKIDNEVAALLPMLEMAKYHAWYVPNVWIARNTQLDHYRYVADKEYRALMDVTIRCFPRYNELETL